MTPPQSRGRRVLELLARYLAVSPRTDFLRLARGALNDRVCRHILGDHGPGPEQTVGSDGHVVAERRVHPQETVRPDVAESGYHDVRRDEAMVADFRVVPDVV